MRKNSLPKQVGELSLACMVYFPNEALRRICPFHKLCLHNLKLKNQFSGILAHDLHWENKTYMLKRSVQFIFPDIMEWCLYVDNHAIDHCRKCHNIP